MNTVLNSRLMNALESLRAQGQCTFHCTWLRNHESLSGLLGPRKSRVLNTVWVKVGDKTATAQEADMNAVSVCGETLAALEAEADRLNFREVALKMANRGARRDLSGRFAGHSCEATGRR